MNSLKFSLIGFVLLIVTSCIKRPEPRQPIEKKSGSFYLQASVEKNKRRNKEEENYIRKLIDQDSVNEYHHTSSGFWYYYIAQNTDQSPTPEVGDRVQFHYNISDLDLNDILSEKEIGKQIYHIDKSNQELISGIRDGLKLMQVGETVTFLFPSYKAYGYYGYEDYIGPNTPLQCTVTLNSIDKTKPKTDYEEN